MSIVKAINIANKTGDKVIICDSETDMSYVVIPLDEYEKMLKVCDDREVLTGDKMIDKINSDIASWRNNEKYNSLDATCNFENTDCSCNENIISCQYHDEMAGQDEGDNEEYANFEGEEDNEEEDEDGDNNYDEGGVENGDRDKRELRSSQSNRKNNWLIPKERRIDVKQHIDEDKQYLEEIPF
ncbi:hypothetical protein ISS03_02270 [Patescibacteria group bacterium]|nr:hypothetical protein [Patescibacteria group bacterium]